MKNMHENPWFSIWLRPRSTIAGIIATNPNRSLWWLAAIYGFTSILNLFQTGTFGAQLTPFAIFLIAAIISPLYGYVAFAIWNFFVTFTGKWLKGKGNFVAVRAAYAWSCVPFIFHIPLWLLMAVMLGQRMFLDITANDLTQTQTGALFGILIVKIVLAIWSLVIYINALAEVQKFSVLRAIFNIILAGVIAVVLFALLWSLIFYFSGAATTHSMTTFHLWNEGLSIESLRESLSH